MQELEVRLAKAQFARRHVSKMAGIGLAAVIARLTMLKPARADADGDNDDTDNDEAPCFLKGTRVRTIKGERKVEDLAIGDLLPTHSNGIQPIKSVVIDSAGVMLRGLGYATCFLFASRVRRSPLTCRIQICTCLSNMPSLQTARWCALGAWLTGQRLRCMMPTT